VRLLEIERITGSNAAVLLAAFRAAHYALQNKRPRNAYPSSYQYNWQDKGRDRSGRH
jgi:hypothetical protein